MVGGAVTGGVWWSSPPQPVGSNTAASAPAVNVLLLLLFIAIRAFRLWVRSRGLQLPPRMLSPSPGMVEPFLILSDDPSASDE